MRGRVNRASAWYRLLGQRLLVAGLVVSHSLVAPSVHGETVVLRNGQRLQGKIRTVNSVKEDPLSPKHGPNTVGRIVVVDDGLRQVYVSVKSIRAGGLQPDALLNTEVVKIPKKVYTTGPHVLQLGAILRTTPFDEFGNRVCTIQSLKGPIDVLQGVTTVTPTYVKVETLSSRAGFAWNMRLSTSSFPRAQLTPLLEKGLDADNPIDRQRIVTLYMQAKRHRDALVELDRTLQRFPQLRDLEVQRRRLYQFVAQEVLDEIERRQEAGQHAFAHHLLTNFPKEGVAGEILLRVEDLLHEYEQFFADRDRCIELLKGHRTELAEIADRAVLESVVQEIEQDLNINNIARMADYLRLADDKTLDASQKMALAVGGWLLGSGAGRRNLSEMLSLVKVRGLARRYLQTDRNGVADRESLLKELETQEGSTPDFLAPLIANMTPPVPVDLPEEPPVPGLLELKVDRGEDRPPGRYWVQLPPEYDPYRRYPCIVALAPLGAPPEREIEYWAGPYVAERKTRLGQATRHGYIVIAPDWGSPGTRRYDYGFESHAAVLSSLRHAMRRFSIDTDRIFLTGHSQGGDAAWDIGVAHPDLWAGVIPIVARGKKYVVFYGPNAKGLPIYLVGGELDQKWLMDQWPVIDRYIKYSGYEGMASLYLGRGHELFHEDVLFAFDWMNRRQRRSPPVELEAVSLRPWDSFFWWVELADYPERNVVLPEMWSEQKPKPVRVTAHRKAANKFRVTTNAGRAVVWLSPEVVDFSKRIFVNGKRVDVAPSRAVLLEDARRRADRQHPFWAVVEATGI